ncbi:MAG: cyclic nucleotide-binding domain-containing protein [Pseudomonadota bacterium]|nr:cyclic nucleotide-binding domain-containing protein [Pseudomonadota bacterium]
MFETVAWTAFLMGIVSACSLPLGALTTRFWTPDDRATAILMAFGGGALLAALTIDLVGSALESGHFNALALGAVLGGFLFVGLNQMVNDFGGFLRKTSTTVYYLRRKEHLRIKRITGQIGRADLLRDLSRRDYKALAPSVRNLDVAKGSAIYQAGDPADALYIVAAGEVELCDSANKAMRTERILRNEAFGWLSCITGAPTSDTAVAATDVSLWVIHKAAVDALVLNSPELAQRVHRLLRSRQVPDYLVQRHGMDPNAAGAWLDKAAHTLVSSGRVPPALPVERNREAFLARLAEVRRFALLHGLPPEEQNQILDRLIYKVHRRGENFFHRHEPASRMFFVERGRVSLIDPHARHREPEFLHGNDAFGGLSLLTGSNHTMTAVATEETAVWELRRRDLDELLRTAPGLAQRVRAFLDAGEAADYLTKRQHFSADKADRWCRSALRALAARQPLPTAAAMSRAHQENAGAPLAIFLGITLDGIPESLVIGASMIHSTISVSLIVGLFLANYPEALSSSLGMRQQGMSFGRVVMMWSALMLITGAGAAAGSQFFIGADPHAFALTEGLAAGAMLTMIAETMLPEAYFKGGSVVGLSTLFGFLVAIYSKTLEPVDPQDHKAPHSAPAETATHAPATHRSPSRLPLQVRGGADQHTGCDPAYRAERANVSSGINPPASGRGPARGHPLRKRLLA